MRLYRHCGGAIATRARNSFGQPLRAALSVSQFLSRGATKGDFLWQGAQGEEDGWLLQVVYDASCHKSQLLIFDAAAISAGPVARLRLKHHIPYGLHGSFTTAV